MYQQWVDELERVSYRYNIISERLQMLSIARLWAPRFGYFDKEARYARSCSILEKALIRLETPRT